MTPEPYTGHLGVSNVQSAQKLTGRLLRKHNINIIDNAEIASVVEDMIKLDSG